MVQKKLFANVEKIKPHSHIDVIMYFIAHLDIEMLSEFLHKETYQDFPRYLFLSKLMTSFEKFESAGDKILSVHKGRCVGCNVGQCGFTFKGQHGHYMDLIFEMDGDKVKDICECTEFQNDYELEDKIVSVDLWPRELPIFIDDDIEDEGPFGNIK